MLTPFARIAFGSAPRKRQCTRYALAFACLVPLVASLVSGCSSGPPRTTAEFCHVYSQQESQYLAEYNHPSTTNGLADLADVVGAISDWVPIFEKLDQVAPPSIEPDVNNIVSSLKQEEKNAGQNASNPLGGLASGLMTAMMASSSWDHLNTFIEQNCVSGR